MRTRALKSVLMKLSALFAFVWIFSDEMNCLAINIKKKQRGTLHHGWMIGFDCYGLVM